MSFRLRCQYFGLALAGLSAYIVVGGCSQPASMLVPVPTDISETQGGMPLLLEGLIPGNVRWPYSATVSPGNATGQNPVIRLLSLLNTFASGAVGGCSKPGSMAVPDVTGITLAQAQATLLLQGLKPGDIRWAYSATVSGGSIISQDPAAETGVTSDAVVDLLCSLGPQLAAVPDVVGRAQTDAQTAITDAGLTLGTVTQSHSPSVAAGTVVSQDPAAGTLALPGAEVALTVSQGPQPVEVPNVVGKTQADAQAAIVAAAFSVGRVVQGSSATVPTGHIMSQNPAAAEMMPPGMAVDLVVSQGPQSVAVPDVVGRTQSDAEATVAGTGFSVGTVTRAWSATVPVGSVISQEPAAGVVLIPDSAINFIVSQGPQPVAVPNLAGKTLTEAQAAVASAGLTVGAVTEQYSDTVPEGSVTGQNPAEGTLLPPGAPVDLVIATQSISICDYYPLAVGNRWVTPGTNGNNGISAEVSEEFVINGCQCWKLTAVDHSLNDKTTHYYAAYANGWMYSYEALEDLFLLPGISSNAQRVAPLSLVPGETFVSVFGASSFSVTPARGRLSDFVDDTRACPFGDVADTIALKLGNLPLIVFGRNLGPLYYNYIMRSEFYSSITIMGGCGVAG